MTVRFPAGFLWGAATAAYQIEGAVDEDGRGPSIWDTFSRTPGAVLHGDTGDVATDAYHRLESDLDLMAEIGLRAYRFSVSWPRVQPDGRGRIEQRGLDFYRRLVDGLLARSITPVLTLYHWDLPQALAEDGGWTSRDVVERFAAYAEIVHNALGDRVPLWLTLNEPACSAYLGYATGEHAPGVTDAQSSVTALHHLLLAHGEAARRLRSAGASRVGITLNFTPVRPATDDPGDVDAARRFDAVHNRVFLDLVLDGRYPDDLLELWGRRFDLSFIRSGDPERIAAPIDFLGVNYYTRETVTLRPPEEAPSASSHPGLSDVATVPPTGATTAMGWAIEPDGMTETLLRAARRRPQLPLYVTENGAAFPDVVDEDGTVRDPDRIAYLDAHLRAVQRAIDQGADVRGYFVWSLVDNFEWAYGYSRRFGIVHVDYETQVRRLKDSGRWYAAVIRRNGLDAASAPSPASAGAERRADR